jgi:hypothetical protein
MLARTLRSTTSIESMIFICRDHASNIKRWRDGKMALRWCVAGMAEAGTQFRRLIDALGRQAFASPKCLTRPPRLLRGASQPRNRSPQRYAADGDLDIRLID